MRIAMLGQKGIPATYGGVERHVEELSARLSARGHEVTAYCRRYYTPPTETHRGVCIVRIGGIRTKHLDTLSHTALALAVAMRRTYDVIHFHSIGPSTLSFLPRLTRSRRVAVVATVHALDWMRRKWSAPARLCLRLAGRAAVLFPHRTIVVSRTMQEYFRARGRDVTYIPNGVPEPERAEIRELTRLGVKRSGFILWMGRIVPEKRVEDVIWAFRLVREDVKLLIAGEPERHDAYFRSVREAAAGDGRIIFAGGLYGRAKAEALTNARLAVFTSELEGFPIALLEAMRYGLPVLASDIPEHLEAVRPSENGFVFAVADRADLAEKLRWMLMNESEVHRAAMQAAEDAGTYDWDGIAARTEEVYRSALRSLRD